MIRVHPAPAALVAHCTRRSAPTLGGATNAGTRDPGDVAALITWLNDRAQFADYSEWVSLGMSLRLEFGDDPGFDLWKLSFDPTVTPDVAAAKWASFASEPTADSITINSFIQRARDAGWRGTIRKSTEALFGQVAAIAQAAGATLPGNAMPMLAGNEELCRVAAPILTDFLANTSDAPNRPLSSDYPTLPDVINAQALRDSLQQAIARIVALSETPKGWKAQRVVDPLAVLSLVHPDTFEAVCRRIRTAGCTVPSIKPAASRISDTVERAFVQQDDWIRDARSGEPQNDNSDNIAVLLRILGCEVRWNAWLERAEIRGHEWRDWTYIDDTIIAKLRTRANRTGTRFRPGKELFWEGMLALAHEAKIDPALEMLDRLALEWDGQPRLSTWLAHTCHTPCDPYHQAVARNIIGGMVRRIREPGVKHDEVAIFYGPQGTGKSTMARILAIEPSYFSDEIMFGDASKELVLSLAGKSVVEVSEMGTKTTTNANHIKAMLSRQVDRGRTAYARSVTERPRRNLFIGTTNDDQPLSDPTGNRRFLPVRVSGEIDLTWLQANVRQLVGEAAHLHSRGVSFALPRAVWSEAATHQDAARSETDVEVKLADWFGETPYTTCAYITASDLVDAANIAGWRGTQGARSAYMKRLGFRADKMYLGGRRIRIWYRGPTAAIDKDAVRYMVGRTADGMVRVEIRRPG